MPSFHDFEVKHQKCNKTSSCKVKHLDVLMASRRCLIDVFSCALHLEWNHNVDGVSNFLDKRLAEISGEPNFWPFCEQNKHNERNDGEGKIKEFK